MKRREKEHKNLKMKGGVLSVWFKIKNIKSYMVTALYNAPSTISHHYQNDIQHNMLV